MIETQDIIFIFVIIFLILMACMFNQTVILKGEIRYWSPQHILGTLRKFMYKVCGKGVMNTAVLFNCRNADYVTVDNLQNSLLTEIWTALNFKLTFVVLIRWRVKLQYLWLATLRDNTCTK